MTISIERDVLHQAIDKLPESTLIELAKFIEFLQFKTQHDEPLSEGWVPLEAYDMPADKSLSPLESLSPRVLGLHKGQGWISEDFNEPLPDAFWLGE